MVMQQFENVLKMAGILSKFEGDLSITAVKIILLDFKIKTDPNTLNNCLNHRMIENRNPWKFPFKPQNCLFQEYLYDDQTRSLWKSSWAGSPLCLSS